MDLIDQLITASNSQEPGEEILPKIEKKVHRSTAWRHKVGQTVPRGNVRNHTNALLQHQQEMDLIAQINKATDRGILPTPRMVYNWAAVIAKKQPGVNWATTFIKRHKNELHSGYIQPLNIERKKADNYYSYKLYFDQINRVKLLVFKLTIC